MHQNLKIILIGDTACGKSKLLQRFIKNEYVAFNSSTHGLSLFQYKYPFTQNHPYKIDNHIEISFYDTAGQDRFQSVHPSYYYGAHCAIMIFDLGRKSTYKHLSENWYQELQQYRPHIPIIVIGNKIDENPEMKSKSFLFAKDKILYLTSAK
eukprot:NODE_452_length_7258_cov_0.721050.p6 type:complete len:152 gc:universal NODE_452_length_7258_cov_0.721050:4697-5152(+)